ncbi:MAG: ribonuclease III [Clostridia bacterium]|nr:ribonuclease III [Clostridia bacterium]
MILGSTDYSPLVLAYLGDAFFATLAREILVTGRNSSLSDLNAQSKSRVTAAAQATMTERMSPLLPEEETRIFKSGRNAKSPHRSRSSTAIQYRMATGLETLYGYFWLNGMTERARELLRKCIEEQEGLS